MADLRHLGKVEGRRRVAELLERFDLVDAAKKPVATYSGGMKRRLDLAMTLDRRPADHLPRRADGGPRSRAAGGSCGTSIRDLVARGVTIFLTTQYLDEADRLAHRIAVLDKGRIVAQGTPNELKRLVPGSHIRLAFRDAATLGPGGRHPRGGTARRGGADPAAPERRRDALAPLAPRPARRRGDRRRRARRPDGRPRRRLPVAHRRPATQPRTEKATRADDHLSRHPGRFGDDAPPQPAPDAPLPVADPLHRRHAGRVPAAVRVRLRRDAGRRACGGVAGGRAEYLAYVLPGILLITVAGAAQGTALSVAMDMSEGIVARFRTMAVARASVLVGPCHRQRRSRRCSPWRSSWSSRC